VPVGLADAGRALWQQVTRRYALRVDELRVLEEAAHLADELATLNAALTGAQAMVPGPRGRMQPNPLLEEARRHRAVYLRALGALGLASADEQGDVRERSRAGRALARQRWASRGG
jgi:hypothetical protein